MCVAKLCLEPLMGGHNLKGEREKEGNKYLHYNKKINRQAGRLKK